VIKQHITSPNSKELVLIPKIYSTLKNIRGISKSKSMTSFIY